MEYKCLFGSKMLKLDNCSDEDWGIITDKQCKYIDGMGTINYTFYSKIIDNFCIGKNVDGDSYKALFLYQLSKEFHKDCEYPFDFNILNYRSILSKCLQTYINLPRVELEATKTSNLPKKFYHLLYQYFMIIEDTYWISEESKVLVQQVHDCNMYASFFYVLKDMINNL